MTIHPTYDAGHPARAGQLVFLIGLMLLMAGVLSFLVGPLIALLPLGSVQSLLLTQIFASLLVFAVPAWVVNLYYRIRYQTSFFHPLAPTGRLDVVLGLLAALLAFVPSAVLEDLMRALPEPEALRAFSLQVTEATDMVVSDRSTSGMVLAVVALVAAAPAAEELLFRGALQQWLLSATRSAHAAVWVGALLFALLHLEWGGMLSRTFMGVVLGYCALYGGLRVSVPLHALNNLVVYLILHFAAESPWATGDGLSRHPVMVLVALLALAAIGGLLYYMSQRTKKKYHHAIR